MHKRQKKRGRPNISGIKEGRKEMILMIVKSSVINKDV